MEYRDNTSPLQGWNKEEKYYLLQALKAYRSYDVERIHEYISTKSPEEIMIAIDHYKKIASKHPVFQKNEIKSKRFIKPRVPLTRWATLLTDKIGLDELKTETPTAVRMIAELEKLPEASCTEDIDFRKIYHTIANAMEGKTLVTDKSTIALLNKCIVETALLSKSFIGMNPYKHLMNSIDKNDKEVHTFPKPTKNQELIILRHLAAQRNYNPLKVSDEFMKPLYSDKM